MPNSASPTTSSHPAEGDMLLQLLKASAQQRDSIQTADMVEDAHLHDPAVAALGPCHTISQYSSHFWPFHASHQSHFQGGLPFPNYAFRPFDSPWSDSFGAWPHASAQRREGLEQINIEGEPVHSSTLQGMKEPSLGASSITQHLNLVTRPAVLSKEMCYSQHTHNERWHPIETHGRIMNVQGVHDAQQDEYKTMAVLRKNKVAEEGDHLHNNSEGLATHSAQATVQADTGWQIAPSSEELEHQDMRDLGSGGTRNERRGRHVRAEYKKKGGNKPFQLQEFAVNRVKEARRALDEVGERVRKVEPQTILRPEVTLQGRTKELSFSKPTDDLKKRRGHMQEWRMKQSQFLGQGRDHCSSVVEQLDYPGLPSNCHVISAPGSALEQSKQSLHDMTSVEQLTAPRKEPWCNYNLDEARGSNQGIREEDEEELLKGIVRILDIDDENAAEESNKDKHTPSTLQIQKAKSDELNQRTIQNNQFNCFGTTPAQTMSRFHRKEVTHRSDIEKLSNELLHLFKSLIAQEEEEIRRKLLLSNLEKIILQSWPQAQLFLFGSCANSFGVCNSDIDVCLSVPDEKSSKPELVMKLADVLRTNEMQHVQALTHARVPIVKFTHPETGLSCDICVNNMLAVVNTKLLHDYAQIDHRLRQLAFIVKHWAKQRQVNETYRGTLSSYAYVLMCIYFLQLRRPAILPCLQEMEPTYDVTISDVHCAYYDQVEKLLNFGKKNKETLGELVISFFDYWAFRHDYRHSVISVRTGSVLSKIEKDWTRRIGNERHLICIEDPFEISHDLGRVVDKHSICILRDEFQRAARILHHHSNPCVTLFEPYVCGKN